MWLILETEFGREANIRIRLADVREMFNLNSRGFIQNPALSGDRPVPFFFASHAAHFASRRNVNRVKKARLRQTTSEQLLQSGSKRKHCYQRCHANRNADSSQGISQ